MGSPFLFYFNRPDNRSRLHRNRMTRADLPIQFNIMFPPLYPPGVMIWLTAYKATKDQFGEGTKRGILGTGWGEEGIRDQVVVLLHILFTFTFLLRLLFLEISFSNLTVPNRQPKQRHK